MEADGGHGKKRTIPDTRLCRSQASSDLGEAERFTAERLANLSWREFLGEPTQELVQVRAEPHPEQYLARVPDSQEEPHLVQIPAVALDLVQVSAWYLELVLAGFCDEKCTSQLSSSFRCKIISGGFLLVRTPRS